MEQGKDREAGFTLVELLVSLAVLSLLAVFFANGIIFGARVWERSGLALDEAAEVEAVQAVLQRQIEGIYPKTRGRSSRSRTLDFEGTPDEIEYWSKLPRAFGEGGYVQTKLGFERRRDGTALVISWCPEGPRSECVSKTLLNDIEDAQFTYFDAKTRAPLVRWSARSDLPGLINVALAFPEGDERVWPDFAATPRLDREAGCRFDPVSKRCRRG